MKFQTGDILKVVSLHSTGNSALGEHGFETGDEVRVLNEFPEDSNYPDHYEVEEKDNEDVSYYVAEDDLEAIEDDK